MNRNTLSSAVLRWCLVAAVLVAAPAVAAVDPRPGKALFEEGQRLFLAGDYREALTRFKKGFLVTEDAAFMLNIAQCHRALGEPKEALMMYRLYLKSTPEGVDREARAVAARAIRELEAEAAAPPAAPAAARSSPEVPAAAPPVSAPLASPPAPPVAPPAPPVASRAPAVAPLPGPAGRGVRPGAGALPTLEALPENEIKKLPEPRVNPTTENAATVRRLRVAGMVCVGAGLLAFGTGAYYWSRASAYSDSANKQTTYNQADYDKGQHAEQMQWIFYGVGAVAVMSGAGLFLYSTWLPAPKHVSVALAPMVGPGAAGLQAQGTF